MRLISVDPDNEAHLRALHQLLLERPCYANISHNEMPTWEEHCRFVRAMAPVPLIDVRKPETMRWPSLGAHLSYEAWELISADDKIVGSVYLTKRDEIGVHIFQEFWCLGFGYDACFELIQKHGKRRYLWNVNPKNEASIALARKLGFSGPIQHTYELEAK